MMHWDTAEKIWGAFDTGDNYRFYVQYYRNPAHSSLTEKQILAHLKRKKFDTNIDIHGRREASILINNKSKNFCLELKRLFMKGTFGINCAIRQAK